MANFAVIGLGRFGRAVARSLVREGQSVLAIDLRRDRLDAVREEVERTVLADTTDEPLIASLGLDEMACVVVTMGSRATEASVLTTAILRDLEIPRIVVRSFDDRHARLLLAIGAHEVLNPEEELARQLATRLAHPSIVAEIRLGEAIVAEVETPECFVGQSLEEVDLWDAYGIRVLALRRAGATQVNPKPEEELASGDILVLMGSSEQVRELAARE